jgi:hypothetical protein
MKFKITKCKKDGFQVGNIETFVEQIDIYKLINTKPFKSIDKTVATIVNGQIIYVGKDFGIERKISETVYNPVTGEFIKGSTFTGNKIANREMQIDIISGIIKKLEKYYKENYIYNNGGKEITRIGGHKSSGFKEAIKFITEQQTLI